MLRPQEQSAARGWGAGTTKGVLPTRPGTRPAHLAEGLPPGPSGFREAPRAARAWASSAASGSDSDSESKPEARNSSTVSSARRLRAPTPESRPPASPVPAPLPGHVGAQRGPCGLERRGEASSAPRLATHRLLPRTPAMPTGCNVSSASGPRMPRASRTSSAGPTPCPAPHAGSAVLQPRLPRSASGRACARPLCRGRQAPGWREGGGSGAGPVRSRLPRASARALGGTCRSRSFSVRGSDNATDLASDGAWGPRGPRAPSPRRVTASPGLRKHVPVRTSVHRQRTECTTEDPYRERLQISNKNPTLW